MRIETRAELPDDTVDVISEIASAAEREVRMLIPELDATITLSIHVGKRVIPETGEVGTSLAPGRLEWTVDPDREGGVAGVARRHLRASLFHELHHQVRGWFVDGGEPVTSFMVGVVAEGMATAFARDAAGEVAPWATYPDDVDGWVTELLSLDLTADYGEWMFQHPDGRRWIGYRAGTYIVDRAIEGCGRSAAHLVRVPTDEVLRLAGLRP